MTSWYFPSLFWYSGKGGLKHVIIYPQVKWPEGETKHGFLKRLCSLEWATKVCGMTRD